MPTIQDIANQINNTLTQINQNTQDTATTAGLIKGDTADLKTKLDDLRNVNQGGFADLALGLFAILESQKLGNSLAEAQVEQGKTIICNLESANDLLCRISRKLAVQIELQQSIQSNAQRMRQVLDLVHAREAAEVARDEALRSAIEECCPPEREPAEECPEPCPTKKVKIYKPEGQDWRPEREAPQESR